MTTKQRRNARHALGLPNREREAYRNYFSAGIGHADYEDWQAMVTHGEAVRRNSRFDNWRGGDGLFHLTEAGARAALDPEIMRQKTRIEP